MEEGAAEGAEERVEGAVLLLVEDLLLFEVTAELLEPSDASASSSTRAALLSCKLMTMKMTMEAMVEAASHPPTPYRSRLTPDWKLSISSLFLLRSS